jgi:hypothetical protein
MRRINVKRTIVFLIMIILISCNYNREDNFKYFFPNRIDEIKGERAHITELKYKIGLFYSNDRSICPADSLIIFKKDGTIFNSKEKIGYWNNDGHFI